jgi:hypothetical protein
LVRLIVSSASGILTGPLEPAMPRSSAAQCTNRPWRSRASSPALRAARAPERRIGSSSSQLSAQVAKASVNRATACASPALAGGSWLIRRAYCAASTAGRSSVPVSARRSSTIWPGGMLRAPIGSPAATISAIRPEVQGGPSVPIASCDHVHRAPRRQPGARRGGERVMH